MSKYKLIPIIIVIPFIMLFIFNKTPIFNKKIENKTYKTYLENDNGDYSVSIDISTRNFTQVV